MEANELRIGNYIDGNRFKTRPETRVAAIKKANQFYNDAH
tara:strand:- start:3376 stop:3495 length:120 start_codon:yes stop_codon:yes gene_type:complete